MQGHAFFEYVDTSVTDVAIQSLNGMEIGDKYLVVQRAEAGMPNLPYDQFLEIPRPIMPAGENNTMDARILLMLNMVTPEDLVDDQEYGDIYEDVKEESSPYGAVEDIRIPRSIKKDKTKFASGDTAFQSALDAQRADEAAGVRQVRKCAGCTICTQGARGTVVCRAVYHCDGAERGQSDDASAQFDLCPAA